MSRLGVHLAPGLGKPAGFLADLSRGVDQRRERGQVIGTREQAKQVEPGDDDDDESDRDGLDDREEKFFIEPYVIPYGHIILRFDLAKARRLYEQETQIEGNP